MRNRPKESETATQAGFAAAGIGVLAVVCCAAGPLIVGVLGGVAVGGALGVGAGVLAVIVVSTLILLRVRHRRACAEPRGQAPVAQPGRGAGS